MRRRAKEWQKREKELGADFKEAGCCPSAIVQGAARRKNGLCEGVPGVTATFGKASSHFDPTQTVSGTVSSR